MKIKKLEARKILNSRGEPTIEISVNKKFKASAPSGASIGKHEVMAFPESGIPIKFINETLSKGLRGFKLNTFEDLKDLESVLFDYDKTEKLEKIGGNTVIALEYALLKAMSKNKIWKFLNPSANKVPMPIANVIGGGMHFKGNSLTFQEILIIPDTEKISEAVYANLYCYKLLGKILKTTEKTDERAWVSNLGEEKTLALIKKVIEAVTRKLGVVLNLGVDIAASSFYKQGRYIYKDKELIRDQQIKYVNELIRKFNLVYVEDALEENDFNGFSEIKAELNVGDDLICTNLDRLQNAEGKINAVIVKPNQIGSLIKTKELVDYALDKGIIPIISHRSGETTDTTISHLAVAWKIPFIKCGVIGSERVAKLNELKYIEREL